MINILFGGNRNVFDGILLCLLSMRKHTSQALNIFILSADVSCLNKNYVPLTKNQINILDCLVKEKNPNSQVSLIMLGKSFNNWILLDCMTSKSIRCLLVFLRSSVWQIRM